MFMNPTIICMNIKRAMLSNKKSDTAVFLLLLLARVRKLEKGHLVGHYYWVNFKYGPK